MRLLSIFALLVMLAGCSTVPMNTAPLNQELSWSARSAQLNQIRDYRAEGLIGIRYQTKAQSANFRFLQKGANYHLELYGPLGADRVILEGSPTKVRLLSSDGQTIQAKTAEALLQERFGWQIPVSYLFYWLRGLPAPGIPKKIRFDAYHHILALEQGSWKINYLRYAGVDAIDLPTKLKIQNSTLEATLIISQWELP